MAAGFTSVRAQSCAPFPFAHLIIEGLMPFPSDCLMVYRHFPAKIEPFLRLLNIPER